MSIRTEEIAEELLALRDDEGVINCHDVVDWARGNPGSRIYAELEWDDVKAAEQHRLWQVRSLIAVHIVDGDGMRRFVNLTVDRTSNNPGYREISEVLEREDLRTIMLRDALAELQRVQRKYESLKELERVWRAAHEVTPPPRPPARRGGRPRAEDRPSA